MTEVEKVREVDCPRRPLAGAEALAEALCEHLERKLDFKIGGEVMFQIPANRDSVAVAAFIRQQQAEITAAETRGWNAAIEAAATLAKLSWASADFKLVGMAEVDKAILLCEHSETEIRTLTKPEGTNND